MKKLLILLFFLLPAAISAQQQGIILFDRQIQYGFEIPENVRNNPRLEQVLAEMPAAHYTSLALLFNESASLMTPAPGEEEEAPVVSDVPRAETMVLRLKMGSAARSDQEVLLDAYVRYEDGMIAETRKFMTRKFLLTGTRPAYQWRPTGEQSEFMGYTVQKATAVQDSSAIEAWFTTEIPVPAGPGPFGGLPGMILSVSVDGGQTLYSATEVRLDPIDAAAIKAPEEGDEVSYEEYEAMVAEKLEEIRMRQRRRGGGDRGGFN
jgi:GLPGLI family protein